MTKVSVIIPSYNCGRFISDAITSVLNQSYKDCEIIVIDDGSTDNTREVLSKFIEGGNITYLYQTNQGVGAARHSGIMASTGEYITFLDADDTLTKDSIEKRLVFALQHPEVGLVFSDYFHQRSESDTTISDHSHLIKRFPNVIYHNPEGIIFSGNIEDYFEVPFNIWTGTVLVKREVFEKVGRFRTDVRITDDRDMWIRISEHFRIGYLNSALAYYKHFRGNLTTSVPAKYFGERLSFLQDLLTRYRNNRKIYIVIRERLEFAHNDIGFYYYNHDKRMKAISYFIRSLYYNPSSRRAEFKHIFRCLLPAMKTTGK